MTTYSDQWHDAADALRRHAAKMDDLAEVAPRRPQAARDAMKVAVCEFLLQENELRGEPFIPPTAINWLRDGIVDAILALDES